MKVKPFVILGLLALAPSACEKAKFSEEKANAFDVQVIDAQGANATGKNGEDYADSGDKAKNDVDEAEADQDAGSCAQAAGLGKERIKMSGSERELTITSDQAFALKVTGNKNEATVKLNSAKPGTRLPALCIFVAGNQNHVTLEIGMPVGQIYIKARGNKALIEGLVSKDGIVENVKVDAKGNEPTIEFKGEGKFPSL